MLEEHSERLLIAIEQALYLIRDIEELDLIPLTLLVPLLVLVLSHKVYHLALHILLLHSLELFHLLLDTLGFPLLLNASLEVLFKLLFLFLEEQLLVLLTSLQLGELFFLFFLELGLLFFLLLFL